MPPEPPPACSGDGNDDNDRVQAPLSLADLLREQALARGQVPSPGLTQPPGAHHCSPLRRWANAVAHPWRSSSGPILPATNTSPASTPSSSASPRSLRSDTTKKEVSFARGHSRSSSTPSAAAHTRWVPPRQHTISPPSTPHEQQQARYSPLSTDSPEHSQAPRPRNALSLTLASPPQEQLSRVRWAGVLGALVGAQIGWTFEMVYATPLLLSSGLSLTQIAAVWFGYALIALSWRLLVPCRETEPDVPQAQRQLVRGTIVSVLGLVALGKVDVLANHLACLGGGVGDWDPVRIHARKGAGQIVFIVALGVLDSGLRSMDRAARTLAKYVPNAWAWAIHGRAQSGSASAPSPVVQPQGIGVVSHLATIVGFLLTGTRLNVRSENLWDWVLSPPTDADEESDTDCQVRRLSGILLVGLTILSGAAYLASSPPNQPPQSPHEPTSPLPPPPPVPRRGGSRSSIWSIVFPATLRPGPEGGPKRAVAQVKAALRPQTLNPYQRRMYLAQLLILMAWLPLVWFGSAFVLLVDRGYNKDRKRFRPGSLPAVFFESGFRTKDAFSAPLDIPAVAWGFTCFALVSTLTSWAIFAVSCRPPRTTIRLPTIWTIAALAAASAMAASLWVRRPLEAGIWLSFLGIPWAVLRFLPTVLLESGGSPTEVVSPVTVPELPSDPPMPSGSSIPTMHRSGWSNPEPRPGSDQPQRLSWRSSLARTGNEPGPAGSLNVGRTSAVSHLAHPVQGSTTTMPMPIPSSPEDVRPPEALARAREAHAGFAFRPTEEGASPASFSVSSSAWRTAARLSTPQLHDTSLPHSIEEDESDHHPTTSDDGSSPPRSPTDVGSMGSSSYSEGPGRPSTSSVRVPGTHAPTTGPTAAHFRRAPTPPSPLQHAPMLRSSTLREHYRTQETPNRKSFGPSLHSLRPDRTDPQGPQDKQQDERAARQAVAKALTNCATLPTRDGQGGNDTCEPSTIEEAVPGHEDLVGKSPAQPIGFPLAGPFEVGCELGINPRLARLVPHVIMSFVVLVSLHLTSDPLHPRLGGRWPVTPAWAFVLSALTASVAAWVVPTKRVDRRPGDGDDDDDDDDEDAV